MKKSVYIFLSGILILTVLFFCIGTLKGRNSGETENNSSVDKNITVHKVNSN